MRIPEGPCATLRWPRLVNLTMACLRIKEGTVPVFILRQRYPTTHDPRMKQPNLTDRFVQNLSNLLQFLIADPDNSRGTCAAVAALAAGEVQSVFVPWLRRRCRQLPIRRRGIFRV